MTVIAYTAARVPTDLLQGSSRVVRPRDAASVYAHPRPEFARLERAGALHRLATGYYAVVPDDQLGRGWLPELEAAGLGIAAVDEGTDSVALMGVSAARIHGAIPRGLAVAVVATTRHRSTLHLADRDAAILFVRRRIADLDVQRHTSELGQGWITTIEQTTLDLAARRGLGGLPEQAQAAAQAQAAGRPRHRPATASQLRPHPQSRLISCPQNWEHSTIPRGQAGPDRGQLLLRRTAAGLVAAAADAHYRRGAGARSSDQVGSLEQGKRADITLVDIDHPRFEPYTNLPALVVNSVTADRVDTVLIDGQVLVRGGRVQTLDEQAARHELREATRRVAGKTGWHISASESRPPTMASSLRYSAGALTGIGARVGWQLARDKISGTD